MIFILASPRVQIAVCQRRSPAKARRTMMLVSTAELATHLDDPTWIVFDCRHDLGNPARGAVCYAAGHVPGARFAPVDEVLSRRPDGTNGRHPLPDPVAFGEFLAGAGVSQHTQIVAYDDVGGQYAARLWWLARWIGHAHVAILDGGWGKWTLENRSTSTDAPADRPAGDLVIRVGSLAVVTTAEVLAALASDHQLIVDARAGERYRGELEPLDPVAGHIPGAVNRFFRQNLRDDLTFRTPAELQAEWLILLAGRPVSSVVHQCGSGITACVNLFALEYAGLTGSRLYAGSWSEWVADRRRPVATG